MIINHMVHSRTQQLDETFFALSDPTRRQMLARLANGDMTVAELSEPFDVSAPAISKHLRVLERAGLLTRERQGRLRKPRTYPLGKLLNGRAVSDIQYAAVRQCNFCHISIREEAKDAGDDIADAAKRLGAEIKEGYDRLLKLL